MATVVLTAAVAMLADGSHRQTEVDADRFETPGPPSANDKPTPAQSDGGKSGLGDSSGEFFADSDDDFGAPMMRPAQSGGSIVPQLATSGGLRPPVIGYSQAYLDSLSDAEYEALVEGLREAGMLDPEQREIQLAALERASAARVGRATRD